MANVSDAVTLSDCAAPAWNSDLGLDMGQQCWCACLLLLLYGLELVEAGIPHLICRSNQTHLRSMPVSCMFDRHALTLLSLKLPLATFQVLHVEVDNTVSAYKGEGYSFVSDSDTLQGTWHTR